LVEAGIATVLFIYVMGVVVGTKYIYNYLRGRGLPHNVVVYYNRKVIHVFAGGVVALLVPIFFTSPIVPTIIAAILTLVTYLPHKRSKLMDWFQVEDNMFEVNFCVMWGVSIFVAWVLLGSPLYAVLPITFMAFGDAVTGFVRNLMYKRRTKSWWGNLAMFTVSAPIGYYFLGWLGLPIAAIASLIEHFEFKPIDDNVLISTVTLAYILALNTFNTIM
jgi:dolichol kinase